MSSPYRCPNCKTNRSRFNIIQQQAESVKLDPQTGEIVQRFTDEDRDAFHMGYKGPEYKVQCGACGLVEDERMFVKFGETK
ncbi:hypothetical protein GCM10008967_28440 [Bacillus carboniphilus]|uniref:DNA alkylation repair protein n=1 Tax=Bacillus carboniphilus TaxID=86663 RepID=A0ABN0WG72_9BACI